MRCPGACFHVNDAGAIAKRNYLRFIKVVRAGEYIDLTASCRKFAGDLTDVHVHAACFRVAEASNRTTMKAYQGDSEHTLSRTELTGCTGWIEDFTPIPCLRRGRL